MLEIDEIEEILSPHMDNLLTSLENIANLIEELEDEKEIEQLKQFVNTQIKENLFIIEDN